MKTPVAGGRGPQENLSARREGARRTVYLLSGLAVLGVAFLAFVLFQTQHWAREHSDSTAEQQTRLAVEFDNALRTYVAKHIRPEMEKRVAPGEFVPEAMSTSFVARSVIGVCAVFLGGVALLIYRDIIQRRRSEDMLRESESRMRAVTDSAQDAILMMDPEGRVSYWNSAAERILGYTSAEALGQNLHEIIAPRHYHAAHHAAFPEFQRTGRGAAIGQTLELQARRKDGREIPVALSLSSVRIGGQWHAVGIVRDETERHQAKENRERLLIRRQGINLLQQSLLESALPEEKLRKVTDGIVRLFDADFCRVWLIRPGDACQRGCVHAQTEEGTHACRGRDRCLHLLASSGRYTHIDGPSHRRVPFGCYKIGRVASGEDHKFITNDATNDPGVHNHQWARELGLVSFAGYQIRVPGGDTLGVLGLFAKHPIDAEEDAMLDGLSATVALVVQQAAMQEALRQSKEEAELYAAALESSNQALEQFNHLAEAATRAKSEFLANMSHEIRTPMTAILGYADLVAESLDCCSKCPARETCEIRAANRRHIKAIRRNGEHLLALINDILDLSKVEAGKTEIEPTRCSPFEFLAEVLSLMRVRAEAKQLKLQTDLADPLPETVLTDPLRLRQVLINLVGNAIKFTDQGEIRVAARLTHDRGSPRLRFDVTDTGIGMDEEQIGRLFQAFSQVDTSASRRAGGTGLGLAISKRLIEAMGGRIEVCSALGEGSTFSVTIDPGPLEGIRMVEQGQGTVLQSPTIAAPAAARKVELHLRILLAEDGPDNQRLISFLLTRAGADVTAVGNGQLAIEAAWAASEAGLPFDVILMDMQMPVLDGYTATRRLRERGYTAPIVALTAHAMADDRQKCLDAGCDDYATKPIDRQQLLATVTHWGARVASNRAASPN